jgi:hypothetical protein
MQDILALGDLCPLFGYHHNIAGEDSGLPRVALRCLERLLPDAFEVFFWRRTIFCRATTEP